MRLHRAVLALGICAAGCAGVQEDMPVTPSKSAPPKVDVEKKQIELPGLVIDRKARFVDVAARVCLREGTLELVACTRAGKVHESIVSVEARPAHIHTALLLLGANPGNPAMRKRDAKADRWVDVPPRGSAIDVFLLCEEKSGKRIERPIRDFIMRAGVEPAAAKRKANRFPTHTFLFAGSRVVDWGEGNKPYVCDLSGNVISLSTFGDELLCLPGVHSQSNVALQWQVDPTHLPAVGTKLTLRLRPKTATNTPELRELPARAIFAKELASLSPGANEVQLKHDGRSRRLIVTTPKTFGRQGPYPVLFCFHGAGGKADGQSRRWGHYADKRGLIVISAEAVQPLAKWNFKDKFHAEDHDDVGFVSKVVAALIANKIVDPKAVYATGHSSGGLFCYRLAKESTLFAALSPMSCGMLKGGHEPGKETKPVSIMQVIGDRDKSFNGSSTRRATMYSATKRIDIWRTFNRCRPVPVVVNTGEEVVVTTYVNQAGIEVAFCKVKGQGHIIRRNLRRSVDSVALDFLLRHKGR